MSSFRRRSDAPALAPPRRAQSSTTRKALPSAETPQPVKKVSRRAVASEAETDEKSVEHRALAAKLRRLETEGKKGTKSYAETSEKHNVALHKRLRELKCDLTDSDMRTMNKPDAEGEIALHKVVYEYFALSSGVQGTTTAKRMEACVFKARALCEAGAKINHKNKYGDTPLLAAAQTDSAEIARVLLTYGADLGLKNRQGYTPLLMAASENRPAALAVVVPEMARQRKKLDVLSGGYSALHWACINNAPASVAVLLKHGADKNCRADPEQQTPLMKAAAYNSAACLEQLLRSRCDATAVDVDMRTGLHHAAKNKATLCAQMLIASGIAVDAKDKHNQKAIFYAAVARSKACVAAISAATPNFKSTPDALKVRLLLQGKRVAAEEDDDLQDEKWGGCFSAAGCF